MNAERLLAELRILDIHMNVEGDQLRCSAPPGRLTKEIKTKIAEHKAELVGALRASAERPEPIARRTVPGTKLPLSFAQERFWFQQNLNPESTAFNITAVQHLQIAVDATVLERALQALVRKHAILRTKFVTADGVPAQEVQEDLPPVLETCDLIQLQGAERAKAVASIIHEFGARRFDFAGGHLFRVVLLRLSVSDCYLVLSAHHMVCDGWSLGIFFAELRTFYEAARCGREGEQADPPVQYGDYTVWEREQLNPAALASRLEYWKEKLKGGPASLEIPLDHARASAAEYQPRHCHFELDAATSESLKRLAQESAATPFMVLLAVFKALLARYTQQDDIVVSTPVSTRTLSELEGLIGCFINTHLLRTEVRQEITARELVSRVRTTVIDSLTHAGVPFEVLVRELVTQRDLSRAPLSQIAFILLNTPQAQEYEVVSGGTALDMTLYMWEAEGRFKGSLEYDGALFDPATIACFTGCFETLAAEMASQPDTPLKEFALLTSDQEEAWFGRHNGPAAELRTGCTHEWVQRQSEATPEKIAVVCGRERLSYRELWTRSSRLADRLRTMGVGRGSLVALCLNRTADLVIAPLAVWQAGGAWVPLDPAYPAERLALILEDAGATVLVTESDLLDRLPGNLPRLICLDREWPEPGNEGGVPTTDSATADDLAYVIYTSGSTGKPKGVEICHRSLVNLLASMQREPGIDSTDRLLAVTTLSFDIAGLELFLPLVSGAEVVIAPSKVVAGGADLAQLLTECHITMMQATPVTWRLLLESGWKGKPGLKILCGGEALPRELAEQLLATGGELWNLYGPTETTIWSTLRRIERPLERVSIGYPIANTQVCVLDENGHPLPPGVPGELFIGGAGLARGYRGGEELTAERFVAGSGCHGGERLYRTGDLVRRLPGGDLEYAGRTDQLVKLRGFRIEPAEVEAALERHPDVLQAVVTAREDKPGDKRLVAYWTARDSAVPDVAELRRSLRDLLPEAMIPTAYVKLENFPLTPNCKVDRRALLGAEFRPNPQGNARDDESLANDGGATVGYSGPGNYVEVVLERIWREVLEVERIGVHDNFFELGGHSLAATQVVSRIRTELEMELPLRSIFVDPTIAGLASNIASDPLARRYSYASNLPQWKRLVPAQPRGSRTPFFFLAGYHGPHGALQFLSHLITHLGEDQPVFGFRPRWMDEGGSDYASVEEIARDYLAELRQVQPTGPYLLGGNCVEGIAVLEMARLLQQEGMEVRLIVLLDTERPCLRGTVHRDLLYLRRRLEHIGEVLSGVVHAKGGERFRMIRQLAARKLGMARSAEEDERDRFYQSIVRYQRLLYSHMPERASGRITLIGNEEELRHNHDFGWTGFASGGLDVHVIAGAHHTMLTEHGKEVAEIIRQSINEVVAQPCEQTVPSEAEVL